MREGGSSKSPELVSLKSQLRLLLAETEVQLLYRAKVWLHYHSGSDKKRALS